MMIVHEGFHDQAEGGGHHERDRELDQVSAHDELFEALEH